jgi:hypothetical protein
VHSSTFAHRLRISYRSEIIQLGKLLLDRFALNNKCVDLFGVLSYLVFAFEDAQCLEFLPQLLEQVKFLVDVCDLRLSLLPNLRVNENFA